VYGWPTQSQRKRSSDMSDLKGKTVLAAATAQATGKARMARATYTTGQACAIDCGWTI